VLTGYHPRSRVAVFYPYKWLGAFHSLHDVFALLAERGYEVEVYAPYYDDCPRPEFQSPSISVINDQEKVFRTSKVSLPHWWTFRKGGRLYRWLFLTVYRPLWWQISFLGRLRKHNSTLPYVCFIGMDPEGLEAAASSAKILNVPVIYWSLELLFADEIVEETRRSLKQLEIRHSCQAYLTIVQDEWRASALVQENGLDATRVLCVPNGRAGVARRSRTTFLHHRFGIEEDRRIVLCAGGLAWWNMSQEIVAAASYWPDDYVLVMHSLSHRPRSEYVDKLSKLADPKHVVVSHDPVSPGQYREMVDSADVGLAFYSPHPPGANSKVSKNHVLIGYSSGKLSDYLFSCLPVIVNSTIGPRDLVTAYECGVCVSDVREIGEALHTIFEDYERYSFNAGRCFTEKLELRKSFEPVIDRIEAIG